MRWRLRISTNTGMTVICPGIISALSITMKISSRPGKRSREKA